MRTITKIIISFFLLSIIGTQAAADDNQVLNSFFSKNKLNESQKTMFHIVYDEKKPDKIRKIKLKKGSRFKVWLNIKYLFQLKSLKILDLTAGEEPSHGIMDSDSTLSRIKNLKNLEVLRLPALDMEAAQYNLFFRTLEKMKNLKKLGISIRNATPKKLKKLPVNTTELDLAKSYYLEYADLSYLPDLKYLNMGFCGITNLALSKFPVNLEEANLYWNTISVVNLAYVTNLKALYLIDCAIENLPACQFPKHLELLNVSGNKTLKKAKLTNMPEINNLNLSKCSLTNVYLKNLNELTKLDLRENPKLKKVKIKGSDHIKWLFLSKELKGKEEKLGLKRYKKIIKYK